MKTTKYLFLIGLLALSTTVFAQQERHRRGLSQGGSEANKGIRMDLKLSEAQQSKFEELRLGTQKAILPLRNQLGENHAKMRTLTTAESPDMKAINKLIDKTSQLEAEIAKIRAANHQTLRMTLTEEQRIKFDSKAHMRKGQDRKPRGGQRGHGHGFKGQSEK